MLLHHAVFKARPASALEIVGQVLRVAPEAASQVYYILLCTIIYYYVLCTIYYAVCCMLYTILTRTYPPPTTPTTPTIYYKADASGALPLHWAGRNAELSSDVLDLLLRLVRTHIY
jgi:hypothetical protein